ncbi:unnamed protein product [Caretta caretta]
MDLVGPLPKSIAGFQYVLVIDYATHFPKAVPLQSLTARTIADELIKLFTRVGLPQEILTDQGTNFTSQLQCKLQPPSCSVSCNFTSQLQCKQTQCLLQVFLRTFTVQPDNMTLVHHTIQTEPGAVIRKLTRPLPHLMQQVVEEEVQAMLDLGVIEPSQSEWRSPLVLVPKPDGTRHFCIDF